MRGGTYIARQSASSVVCIVLTLAFLRPVEANTRALQKGNLKNGRPGTHFKLVEFVDENFGWAAKDHSLWKTEDGGESWVVIRHSPKRIVQNVSGSHKSQLFIDRIQALSRDKGWILEDAALLHTTDGGRHWNKFERDKLDIRAFRFADEQNGFFIAERLHYGNNITFWREGEIYRTSNGGKSWETVRLNKRLAWTWLLDLWLSSKDHIWVVGDLFLNSQDGGKTWRKINIKTGNGFYGRATHVEFVDANQGWIAAIYGFAITTNGGKTWFRTGSKRRVKNLIARTRGHVWRTDG
jgi:photosystem II stability/assembly factor-like uncharacterized protein